MHAPLVAGIDAGATSTRCVVATADGVVLGRGRSSGANQNSSGGRPAQALEQALREALRGIDPASVAAGVVGAAGAASAGRAEARAAAEEAWHAAGLSGAPRSVTDLEVAFAAGTPRKDGLLLLSGTGAAAVAFRDRVPHRRCDGYGWLLGDEGSAVWQGREALRAVLRALDGRGPATGLTEPAIAMLRTPASTEPATAMPGSPAGTEPAIAMLRTPAGTDPQERAQALVRVAYRRPPAELGLLAPLVGQAALDGDAVARAIVEEAAAHLLHSLGTVAGGGAETVVLAGSVLLTAGPVADLVRAGVSRRFRVEPAEARDGAAGAVVLAIAALTGVPVSNAVHTRLTA
ncbi:BadF/BadG/BcrA/BcrD ATPase family protein [Dactylosporangium sp. NPDC005555]|uniref:N-acetylglucosamine kinase n=1 Tax=Dactylosporangium sp. NPDC005555 TaxID=3154889 RepID=UPI0033AD9EF6